MNPFLRHLVISMSVLFRVLWDWDLTWCVAFLAPFLDWLDFLLSAMERLPLPFGEGGSGASSSKKPTIPDLNLPATQVASPSPGAAQEALPQAAAPEEVAHPDPDQEERAALLLEVQALIIEQLQEESKKAQGVRLSVLFPEMREVDSSAAESIMYYDLEISRETDAESLREWVEKIRDDPNLLKPLIKDYLPKRR